MALEVHNLNLFGLDLARLPALLRDGWAEAMQWPVFARLSPVVAVRVVTGDGQTTLRSPETGQVLQGQADTGFTAVSLPDEAVLWRELLLPDLPGEQLREALLLEVAASSPFGVEQTAWGWRTQRTAEGRLAVSLAMCNRAAAEQFLQQYGDPSRSEVWAGDAQPVVLQGFGEGHRQARQKQQLLKNIGVWVVVALVFVLLVLTPFLQLRQQVFEAQARFAELEGRAANVVAARSQLQTARDQLLEIREQGQQRANLPLLIETLARVMPDSAYIIRMTVQGREVQVAGQGVNVSGLLTQLGAEPSFQNLRSTAPVSQVGGTNEEQFTIEFTFQPEQP